MRACLSGGRQYGFTLFEVIIAIGIFSIIGLSAHHVLHIVISAEAAVAAHGAASSRLQRAMLLLSNDLEQVVDRPVKDARGEWLGALVAGNHGYLLEFTRQGWRNSPRLPRSNLQRVAYGLEDHADPHAPGDSRVSLVRYYWLGLDRASDSPAKSQVLLNKVLDTRVRFLDQEGDWHSEWPLQQEPADRVEHALPVAVEIAIETGNAGMITRLFQTGDP